MLSIRKYLVALMLAGSALAAPAQSAAEPLVEAAHQAWQRRDAARLAPLVEQAIAQGHLLAPWLDYWQQQLRLSKLGADDFAAFAQRWPASYVEDRLRNDWLLELGQRADWPAFAAEYPRFRMDDDRELHCHALRAEHALRRPLRGEPAASFKQRALTAWLAQREADEGCRRLAETLLDEKMFGPAELQRKLLRSAEEGGARSFRQSAGLAAHTKSLNAAWDDPRRWLRRPPRGAPPEALAVALARLGASDPVEAAEQLRERPARALTPALRQWLHLQLARQMTQRQLPEAVEQARSALQLHGALPPTQWSEASLAWAVRAALRAADWALLHQLLSPLPEALARDAAWPYWRAQAAYRSAVEGQAGDAQRREAREQLRLLAQAPSAALHFYGQLAADELGLHQALPQAPTPPSSAERQAAQDHLGLTRALRLIELGLRSEGVREWNFALRDLAGDDRALLAAAARACAAAVWDRCINTSERTQAQLDLAQRYPMPYREQVLAQARAAGLDPADPYGLMRQESRFISDARSGVGAAGLMQVMPATARWTARQLGLPYSPGALKDLDFNLRIGMAYLRRVLDDFGGALPLAAAAYNAGPGRPRRWREGAPLDAAAWAETIPFSETRDYVKKVLANATVYARLMGNEDARLRQRLGTQIGPRSGGPAIDEELP
jgi:soluble lytic murein transglycosylase